jgi:MinD-like ATPase involved in chromosome partitioning or flagellar assembly
VAVVVFCSAKGSPGVTTGALLTAALWPRPVLLVDADPAGGDVALRLPGPDGSPLGVGRGLLSLLPTARRTLDPTLLFEHAQEVSGGIPVLAGLAGPEQAGAVGELWGVLARAFAALTGGDVIVDAGRVHSQAAHLPLLRQADMVTCVLRPTVPGVVHTRERLRQLEPVLHRADGSRPRIGLAVVAPADDRDTVAEVVHSIHAELSFVELFGHLALDARGARIFEGIPVSRPQHTMLVRSGGELVRVLVELLPAVPAATADPVGASPPVAAAEPASAQEPVPVEEPATAQEPAGGTPRGGATTDPVPAPEDTVPGDAREAVPPESRPESPPPAAVSPDAPAVPAEGTDPAGDVVRPVPAERRKSPVPDVEAAR